MFLEKLGVCHLKVQAMGAIHDDSVTISSYQSKRCCVGKNWGGQTGRERVAVSKRTEDGCTVTYSDELSR